MIIYILRSTPTEIYFHEKYSMQDIYFQLKAEKVTAMIKDENTSKISKNSLKYHAY